MTRPRIRTWTLRATGRLWTPPRSPRLRRVIRAGMEARRRLRRTPTRWWRGGWGKVFSLPADKLTKGVPWVAVDGVRGAMYAAEWDPAPAVLVFHLGDASFEREIPLSEVLGRIQGAKVFEGALYANSDNAAKTIYKLNLETGTVIELFALNQTFEMEGIAFLAMPDGTLMHTQNATTQATAMEYRHHKRVREPLRRGSARKGTRGE